MIGAGRPRRRELFPVALGLFLTSCGGGGGDSRLNPQGPTPGPAFPAGTALTFVSAESVAPVAGAKVVVAGRSYSADGAGRVFLQEPVEAGAPVDVLASGYFDRQTSLRVRSAGRFTLWPKTSPTKLDEDFTAHIVYTAASGDNPPLTAQPLCRLPEGTGEVYIVPSAELQADDLAMSNCRNAAASVTDANRGQVLYSVGADAPSGAVRFDLRVDPADEGCTAGKVRAYVGWSLRNGEIIGGVMVFCAREAVYATTVAHEMGHTFGLEHSPNARELMGTPFSRERAAGFSDRESLAMQLLLQRRGGNRFPDNDRDVTIASERARVTIACPE